MSGGSTAQFQEQRREIVFKGQLQQKITKRFGTLLRKKKAIYEDELWVLLCIHEGGIGGIPHLEWYGDLRSAYEHNPLKVQDLLNCQYVNVAIGEERCMVIGFVDKNRPVLELSAPSVEERRQWVAKLTETLRRLKCPLDDENSQQNDDGNEGIVGPSTCCPRPQNEYVALNEVDEFGGESSLPNFPSSDQLPPPPSSPYVPMAAANSPPGIKLSLADPIPMHSSPPSTSASPPHFHPQCSFSTTSQASPSTLPRIQRPKPPLTPSKPISIKMPLTPRQQLSPNSNGNFQRSMNENDEIEEENEEENGDKGNDMEKEEKAKKEEENNNLPPPLPPRKSQNHLQQSQQTMPSSCSPTPPILPISPIPSSPPPSTTILNSSPNADAINNCEYRALEPTIRRPIPNNNNQFRTEYDQLSPSTAAAAGMSFQNQYQQLSRLSGDFAEPSTGGSVLRFSNSSSANTYSSASPNSSQRSSATGGLGQQNLPGQMQRPQQISSPRHSSGSDSQQQQYDILAPLHYSPSAQMPLPVMNFADHIFQETLARPRRVSLSLSLLAEHVAFVDAGGKVWVAGWSPKADTNLRNILHFGDEVERMAGIELRSVKQLPEIYAQTKPGIQIELGLRANPRAKVYTLQRPANPKRELGIVLHKRKNKIASIEPRSPADKANLPARLPPFFYNKEATELPTMITELDGVPLSLFARNEQFFHRLEPTPLNAAINLTLHPSDFCSYIASQMKAQIREHRRFVHDQ